MDREKPDIVYSEPVNEIIAKPPGMILRWGTAVLLLVFALFIIFAAIIKYPDSIPASVEITTVNPPVTMVSKIPGRIKNLYVKDKQIVQEGQLLAVMETAASIDELNLLRQFVDSLKDPEILIFSELPYFTELGEIQTYWSSFRKSLSDYSSYNMNDFYGNKIRSINDEIDGILTYIDRVKIKEKLYSENRLIESQKFKRDSLLYVNKVLSISDLERSHQSLIKTNIELQEVRLDHSSKLIELAEKRQLLQDYKIKKLEDRDKYYSVLNEAFLNLKAQVKIWENTYLLISPVGGVVTFTKFWTENQSVARDEPVIGIVPLETGDYVGRISLKMSRSGKVRPGQQANIKLSSYPYLEFGMLKGIIKSKSLVPSGDTYVIEVNLPSGLTTMYGRKLEFTQNMQGTAEIITDDISLLRKIINPFRYLISRNIN